MCLSMHERIARFIFTQLADGLEYLHEEAFVMNGDIKLENMLFTTRENGTDNRLFDRAQITDFTMALKLDPTTADTCLKALG